LKARLGYHPLTDLFPPERILKEIVLAEKVGFDSIFIADHFHPWTVAEGTGFAWTLIASAAERTSTVKIGTAVTCPMFRYNPSIVAQAFATLGATYEGRIFLGVGTGEALNEVPVGHKWPRTYVRLEMLEESTQIIKGLWDAEDYFSFNGKHYRVKKAKLFTKPLEPVPLYISAFGAKSARLAGKYADGLITTATHEEMTTNIFAALEDGARDVGRNSSKILKIAEVLVSYDQDLDRAVEAARSIAGAMLPYVSKYAVYDPRDIKAHADLLDPRVIKDMMLVTNDIGTLSRRLQRLYERGFDWVELASISPSNETFLKLLGEAVVPRFVGRD
jgi:G6PDH family F420-dependent oxidoreductase